MSKKNEQHLDLENQMEVFGRAAECVLTLQDDLEKKTRVAEQTLAELEAGFDRLLADYQLGKTDFNELLPDYQLRKVSLADVDDYQGRMDQCRMLMETLPRARKALNREEARLKGKLTSLRGALTVQNTFVSSWEKAEASLDEKFEYRTESAAALERAARRVNRIGEVKDLIDELRQRQRAA